MATRRSATFIAVALVVSCILSSTRSNKERIAVELLLGILSTVLAAVAVFASYHIAVRQGFFGGEAILLTASQPTALKNSDPLPPCGRRLSSYGIGWSRLTYPLLLRMPLLVTFGIPPDRSPHLVFLLVTLLNRRRATVNHVTVRIGLPAHLMPDPMAKFGAPDGMKVRRHIDAATNEGTVEYEIERIKPHDCIFIAEPLLLRPEHLLATKASETVTADQLMEMRFLLLTSRAVQEEKLKITGIKCSDQDRLIEVSRTLTNTLMRSEPKKIKKPLLQRFFHIPAAYRATLWVQPGFHQPDKDINVHTFGKSNDQTKSDLLFILIK